MKLLPLLLATLSAPAFLAPRAHAQLTPATPTTPAPTVPAANPGIDPAAVALLDQSAKAYAALTGASMSFTAFDQEGGKTTNATGTIAFARPGKARLEFKIGPKKVLLLSDGTKLTVQNRPEEYLVNPVQGQNPIPGILQSVPSALGLVLPPLVLGESPLAIGQIRWQKAALLPNEGVSLSANVGTANPSILFRLYFDPTDHLLRRVEAELSVRGQKNLNVTTLTGVEINPTLPENAFAFTPPTGAKLVAKPTPYNPSLKVGALPLALNSRDLQGNTYPWSKYAGKVVLLHFWATWSKPATADIPTFTKLLKKYQNSGFRVLGVSLDDNKSELQNFVKLHSISYPQIFDRRGWQVGDARRYELLSFPFSLLIGKNGKIVAVNPRGAALESAIQKALRAK